MLGYNYSVHLDKWHISDMAADYVFVGDNDIDFEIPGTLGIIYNYNNWKIHKKGYPILNVAQYMIEEERSDKMNMIHVCLSDLNREFFDKLQDDKTAVLLIDTYNKNGIAEQRKLFVHLINNEVKTPVIIGRAYGDLSEEQLQLHKCDFGTIIRWVRRWNIYSSRNCGSDQMINSLGFGILQSRTRISKTEYISCPKLWRTLFDLQKPLQNPRNDHLKG